MYVAMIAARIGSERLPRKNFCLVGGVPVVAHALRAAKAAGVFDRVVLNSDSIEFAGIASTEDVGFYLRPAELGGNQVPFDAVVADFLEKHDCQILAVVNTPSVLQTGQEVASVVRSFVDRGLDSLITTLPLQRHAMYNDHPVNWEIGQKFARTQDLEPVRIFAYSVMMWRRSAFLASYRTTGTGVVCGKFGTFDVSHEAGTLLKTDFDLRVIRAIYQAQNSLLADNSETPNST